MQRFQNKHEYATFPKRRNATLQNKRMPGNVVFTGFSGCFMFPNARFQNNTNKANVRINFRKFYWLQNAGKSGIIISGWTEYFSTPADPSPFMAAGSFKTRAWEWFNDRSSSSCSCAFSVYSLI